MYTNVDAIKALSLEVVGHAANSTYESDCIMHIAESYMLDSAAKPDKPGTVKQAAAVPDVTGDVPTKDEFNALLAALRNAGVLEKSVV